MFWLGVVAFALALGVAIMLHEAGHLLTAKAFGMKASEYFVGFGPRIASFRRGETEYGLKAVPAGGYVKIVGMTDLEPVDPEDEARAFYRQPAWQRLVVLVSGSLTHFVLAFVTLYAVVVGFGYTAFTPDHPEVAVAGCLPDEIDLGEQAAAAAQDRTYDPCAQGSAGPAPAAAAGVQPGDVLLSVDGQGVRSSGDASELIRASGGQPLALEVRRGEEVVDLVLTPGTTSLVGEDASGERAAEQVPFAGLRFPRVPFQEHGPVDGLGRAAQATGDLFEGTGRAIWSLPERVPNLWESVFLGEERDPEGVVSVVGASRLGGEAVESLEGGGRLATFGLLFASINVFIGVLNLFPLLPLDGGHVAVLLYERARSAVARVLGRRDPGRVDITKLLPLTYVVVLVGGVFMLLAVTADVVAPIANPFR